MIGPVCRVSEPMLLETLTMRGDVRAPQQRQHRVRHADDAEDVGVEDGADDVQVERRRVLRAATEPAGDAGVVDEDVEAPGGLLDRRGGLGDAVVGGDVQGDAERVDAGAAQPLDGASARRVSSRAPTATVKPRAPSPAAMAKPMPLFAPVTSAVFLSFT